MPPVRLIPEIEGEVVLQSDIEYGYCIHCKRPYSPQLRAEAAILLLPDPERRIIWWHISCPSKYDDWT